MKFRALTAKEIECRVSTVSEKGVSLLLYKDARCDMKILDETVGAENWEREHYECKGNLFCRVSININYDDSAMPKEWVSKSDCGTESYTEKEKGESSDSFKRACFNWGIGRELYTAPFIWINAGDVELLDYKGKKSTRDRFSVADITIEDGKIIGLIISRDKRNGREEKIVYEYPKSKESVQNNIHQKNQDSKIPKENPTDLICPLEAKTIIESCAELRIQVKETFLDKFKIDKVEQMTKADYKRAMAVIEKTRIKNAKA